MAYLYIYVTYFSIRVSGAQLRPMDFQCSYSMAGEAQEAHYVSWLIDVSTLLNFLWEVQEPNYVP